MEQEVTLRTSPRLVRGMTSQSLPFFYVPDAQGSVLVGNDVIASVIDAAANEISFGALHAQTGLAAAALEPLVRFLLERGIIVNTKYTAPAPIPGTAMLPPKKAQLWFHVTNACTLRCAYCHVKKDATCMSIPVATQLAEKVCRDAFDHGFDSVTLKFAGGEPILAFDAIRAVVAHLAVLEQSDARFTHVGYAILTNACLVTPEHARYLADHRFNIGVSIDGIGDVNDRERVTIGGRGSFEQVLRGLEHLRDQGLRPHITCVVTPKNIEGLADVLCEAARWGCTTRLNPVRDARLIRRLIDEGQYDAFLDRMIAELDRAYRAVALVDARPILGTHDFADISFGQPIERACNVGDSYGAITQLGYVASCQEWLDTPFAPVASANTFATIQSRSQYAFDDQHHDENPCTTCQWRPVCAGGCPSLKVHLTGRIDVPSPYCRVFKAIIPLLLALTAEQVARAAIARAQVA